LLATVLAGRLAVLAGRAARLRFAIDASALAAFLADLRSAPPTAAVSACSGCPQS